MFIALCLVVFAERVFCVLQPELTLPPSADVRSAFPARCTFDATATSPQTAAVSSGAAPSGLHSMKLFVNNVEVFRYYPTIDPHYTKFESGASAVRARSWECSARACAVRLRAPAGRLAVRCELAARGPTYDIRASDGLVDVIGSPIYDPTIVGEPAGPVAPGSVLRLNCSTDLAAPPADVVWYLDGKQMDNASTSSLVLGGPDEQGLRKSWRGARFAVPRGQGPLSVECGARQPGVTGERRSTLVLERAQPTLSKYTAANEAPPLLTSRPLLASILLATLALNHR